MPKYLIQVRDKRTCDISYRVIRKVLYAVNLERLLDQLEDHRFSQLEIDILAIEE